MAENQVGSVGYGLELNAADNGLLKALEQATKAIEKLEQSVSAMSSKFEQNVKKAQQSVSGLGSKTEESFKKAEKAITPSIGKLEDLTAQYQKVRTAAQGAGNTEAFEKAGRAMRAYQQQLRTGFQSTSHMNEATSRLRAEMSQVQQTVDRQQRAYIAMQKSVGSAERQVSSLISKLQGMDNSEQPINELTQALERYRVNIRNAGADQTKVTAAQEEFKNSLQKVRNATQSTTDPFQQNAIALRNMADATILALGPLSGIATRILTFSRLVKNNTAVIATFTATIVSLGATLTRAVRAGIEFERQMLGMEAAIKATGREAETSAEQINMLAESIAEATLSGTQETRQAANILLTFGGLSVKVFEDVLVAAQGVSSLFSSGLTANARLLARALEEPARNLDSLRRVGIQFTDQQRASIEAFERFGQTAQAQNIILERFRVFQELARKEAGGLAGALDTLGERMTKAYEAISANADINDTLATGVNALANVIKVLTENLQAVEPVMVLFRTIISSASATLVFLEKNLGAVTAIATAFFTAVIAKGISSIVALTVRLTVSTKVFQGLAAAVTLNTAAMKASIASARTLAGAMALVRASIFPIIGIVTGVVAIFASAQSKTEAYSAGLEALTRSTDRSTEAQANLRNEIDLTGEASLRQSEALLVQARSDYENISVAATEAFSRVRGELDSLLNRTSMINLSAYADVSAVRTQFANIVSRIQDGVRVSNREIESLQESLQSLGIETEFNERTVGEWAKGLNDAGREIVNIENRLNSLNQTLQETGVNFDLSAIAKLLQEDYGNILGDIESTIQGTEIAVVDSLLSIGNNAEQVARQITRAMEIQAINAMEAEIQRLNAAGEDTTEAFNRWGRVFANIDARTKDLTDRLQGLSQEFSQIQRQGFEDSIRNIAREIQILSAGSREAQNSLRRQFEVSDLTQSLLDELSEVEQNYNSAAEAAEYFQSVGLLSGVDASQFQTFDQLRSAIRGITSDLGVLRERDSRSNDRGAKRQEKAIQGLIDNYHEYIDVIEQQQSLMRGGEDALELTIRLQEEAEAIRNVDEALKDINRSSLAEFNQQTGMNIQSVEELRTTLIRMYRDSENASRSIERQTEAISTLEDFFESTRSEVENVRAEYIEYLQAAGELGNLEAVVAIHEEMNRVMRETQGEVQRTTEALRMQADQMANFGGISAIAESFQGGFEAVQKLQEQLLNEDFLEQLREAYTGDNFSAFIEQLQSVSDVASKAGASMTAMGMLGQQGMELMQAAGREGSSMYKAFAIASIIASQAMAVADAWVASMKFGAMIGQPQVGIGLATAMTGLIGATMGAQIAAVNSSGFANGGLVTGPGTGTSDSIPARLSNGEFVMKASAVRSLGLDTLEQMNEGKMPLFASGGPVGSVPMPMQMDSGIHVTINDYSTGNKTFETQEEVGPGGQRQLKILVRDAVKESIRSGEIDKDMASAYGVTRRGRKR